MMTSVIHHPIETCPMEKINLYDLFSLSGFPELQEKYVRALWGCQETKQFRNTEIESTKSLVQQLGLGRSDYSNFYYSYSIPQLGKEFDLLKAGSNGIVDIEIKMESITESKIQRQLIQNEYYLRASGLSPKTFCLCRRNKKLLHVAERNAS